MSAEKQREVPHGISFFAKKTALIIEEKFSPIPRRALLFFFLFPDRKVDMFVLLAYVIIAAVLILMFFLALPLIFAIIMSAAVLFVFGTTPIWGKI